MSNTKDTDRRRLLVRIFAFLSIVSFDIIIGRNSNNYTTTTSLFFDGHNANSSKNITNNYIHTINNDYTSRNNDTIRISFQLHDPTIVPFTDLFSGNYGCKLGPLSTGGVRTGELPPSLLLGGQDMNGHVHGRVLDFTTTISNSLKILHIGDSVTFQIAQALDEMMGGTEKTRTNLWEAYKGGEGGTIVAPTRGGGINGAWRITALLSQAARGLPETKNKVGGGWNYYQSNYFLNHEYVTTNNEGGGITTVKKLDAVIFRVMHGWMSVEEITRERIIEAAMLANSILGAETIIFITAPFTNNVKDAHMYEGVCKVNEMIWDVAENWHHDHPESIVLVLDYAAYSNHVIWTNGIQLGYNISDPLTVKDPQVFDNEGVYMLERLNQKTCPPSIPMVCNKMPTSESGGAYCERNILFNDGMHMCTETMASRIGAAVACLLGCVYNRKGQSSSSSLVDSSVQLMQKESAATTKLETRIMKIRACERQCNAQFSSVLPVKENWINTTLASFAD